MRYNLLAACMMHVEGFYSTKSLAYKNKNPGNIEHSNGQFIVYSSILNGYIGLYLDILANKGKTLAQFISKYAPPNENNTGTYLSTVSELSGIGVNEIL